MRLLRVVAPLALVLAVQCKTPDSGAGGGSEVRADTTPGGPFALTLPTIGDEADYLEKSREALDGLGVPAAQLDARAKRLAHYLAFLGVDLDKPTGKAVLNRLLTSSLQFLVCDAALDWPCLEKKPEITPRRKFRQDTRDDLGKPLAVSGPLKLDFWLTDQWDKEESAADMSKMLALQLAKKIKEEGKDGVSMAFYGIDDTEGSMKPVYDAIVEKKAAGTMVRAVVDTEGYKKNFDGFPLVYTFKKPAGGTDWIFTEDDAGKTPIAFQYTGTVGLVNALNKGISSDGDAKARIEWPDSGIMHNKFAVLKKAGKLGVWTGTANVANTCMGTERNSNMGIYISNTEVAQSFLDEFEEMYGWRDNSFADPAKLKNATGGDDIRIGHFHADKTPNTRRYFKFNDGNELHVHFAPTDDGEHRVIVPLLLSAQAGDKFRIAMFGGGGIETVRAIQWAVAKGADVKIVFDRLTGANLYSWIKDRTGNLMQPNPFAATPSGKLTVRMSTWAGLNHHKTATVTRKATGKAEYLVIGSQNWSKQGNDQNDENMTTVYNPAGVTAAVAFNEHFDARLWPAAAAGEIDPATFPQNGGGNGGGNENDASPQSMEGVARDRERLTPAEQDPRAPRDDD